MISEFYMLPTRFLTTGWRRYLGDGRFSFIVFSNTDYAKSSAGDFAFT